MMDWDKIWAFNKKVIFYFMVHGLWCLQCFDAVGWVAEMPGHAACKKAELWGAGKVICLE